MSEKIFGYDWRDIQAMQQNAWIAPIVRGVSPDKQSEQITSDVERFKIDVDKSVKDALGIVLPDGYALIGGVWKYQAKP